MRSNADKKVVFTVAPYVDSFLKVESLPVTWLQAAEVKCSISRWQLLTADESRNASALNLAITELGFSDVVLEDV